MPPKKKIHDPKARPITAFFNSAKNNEGHMAPTRGGKSNGESSNLPKQEFNATSKSESTVQNPKAAVLLESHWGDEGKENINTEKVSKLQRLGSIDERHTTATHKSSGTTAGGKGEGHNKRQLQSDPASELDDFPNSNDANASGQSVGIENMSNPCPQQTETIAIPRAECGPDQDPDQDISLVTQEVESEGRYHERPVKDRDGKYASAYMWHIDMHQPEKLDPVFVTDAAASLCLGYTLEELKRAVKARRDMETLPKSEWQTEIGVTPCRQPEAVFRDISKVDDLVDMGLSFIIKIYKDMGSIASQDLLEFIDRISLKEATNRLRKSFTDTAENLLQAIIDQNYEHTLTELLMKSQGRQWKGKYGGGAYFGAGYHEKHGLLSYVGRSRDVLGRIMEHLRLIGKAPYHPTESSKTFYRAARLWLRDEGIVKFFKLSDLPEDTSDESKMVAIAEGFWCVLLQSYTACYLWLQKRAKAGFRPMSVFGTNMDSCTGNTFTIRNSTENLEVNATLEDYLLEMSSLRYELGQARAKLKLQKFLSVKIVAIAKDEEPALVKRRDALSAAYDRELMNLIRSGQFNGRVRVIDKTHGYITNFFKLKILMDDLKKLFPKEQLQAGQHNLVVRIKFEEREDAEIESDYFIAVTASERKLYTGWSIRAQTKDYAFSLQHTEAIANSPKTKILADFLLRESATRKNRLAAAASIAPPMLPLGTPTVIKQLIQGEIKSYRKHRDGKRRFIIQERNHMPEFEVPDCADFIRDIDDKVQTVYFRLVFDGRYPTFSTYPADNEDEALMSTMTGLQYATFAGEWKHVTGSKWWSNQGKGFFFYQFLDAYLLAKNLGLLQPISHQDRSSIEQLHAAAIKEPEDTPDEPKWCHRTEHAIYARADKLAWILKPIIQSPRPRLNGFNGVTNFGIPKALASSFFPDLDDSTAMKNTSFWIKIDAWKRERTEIKQYICRISPGPYQGVWLDVSFFQRTNKKVVALAMWLDACYVNGRKVDAKGNDMQPSSGSCKDV